MSSTRFGRRRALACAALLAALPLVPSCARAADELRVARRIPLPGVRGRIDHFGFDPATARVFVAALGNDTVEVVDLAGGRHLGEVHGVREPQGVLYHAASARLLVACGGSGRLAAFDGKTLAPVGELNGVDDADNLRVDASSGDVWLGYGRALAVIDAGTLAARARIALPAHPEAFALERDGARGFVNLPQAQAIGVVDRETRRLVTTWHVDAGANFPMALDEAHGRLFVAARRPPLLLAYDVASGREIGRTSIAGDCDDLFLDASRRRVYAIGGEGRVDVVELDERAALRAVASIATRAGARTGLFLPTRSELVVALPARAGAPAQLDVLTVA